MFGTNNVDPQEPQFENKYLGIGRHFAKIVDAEVVTASTGSQKVVWILEDDSDLENPEEGHQGKIGRIHDSWLANEQQQTRFNENIAMIAKKLNKKEEVDKIQASDLQSYVDAVLPIIRDQYLWWRIVGEKYDKGDGKEGTKLSFSYIRPFVANEREGEEHLKEVDENNKFDLKPLETPQSGDVNTGQEAATYYE